MPAAAPAISFIRSAAAASRSSITASTRPRPSLRSGRSELAAFGLPEDRLRTLRIEDFQGSADHVLCMNVLSNIDNYHRPLERLLKAARRSLILRESIKDGSSYSYVRDNFLDPDVNLHVHVNAYDRSELVGFH